MDFTTLYEKERQARKEGNIEELKNCFIQILQLSSDDKEIVSLIKVLAARRGQDKSAIKWIVNKVYEDKKNQFELVKSLLTEVIEGKMYLESERIRVTLDLKEYYEKESLYTNALEVIQIPVETFTMVPENIIVQYQLEQFRLCVLLKDWVRSEITMKKIRKRYFKENNAIKEEVLFYKYIVDLYLGQEKFLEASSTYILLNQIVEKKEFIVLSSFYAILCTCEGEKKDIREERRKIIKKLTEDKNNEEGMRIVLDRFLSNLLIEKSFIDSISSIVQSYTKESYNNAIRRAVDEHNFFVVEKFYKTISISTLCNLLEDKSILERISFMVNNKLSVAKVNQKEGTVEFGNKEKNSEVGGVLNKIVKVEHLIHKEKLK